MKILFYEWENFCTNDMREAFESLGHNVVMKKATQEELLSPALVERICREAGEEAPSALFTFNYFPNVAIACKEIGLDYYSWVYDNPAIQLYSYTVIFPTNHIFVFDSDTYLYFKSQGITNIEYLPMAANPDRLEKLWEADGLKTNETSLLGNSRICCDKDISFVGSLYNEKHNFYSRMQLPQYSSGYLRGIMEAQKKVYGENFVQRMITKDLLEEMHKSLPLEPASDSAASMEYMFAQFVINRQITAEERMNMLQVLGKRYKVDLYTPNKETRIEGCVNHGVAEIYEETPRIFHLSKINLNISLRSIVNGIPLRCFDIMGAGGFLLTNYQGDFLQFFEPGVDYVYYDSVEDMVGKVEYYLSHEDERAQIARNGLEKVKNGHTFVDRAREMLG